MNILYEFIYLPIFIQVISLVAVSLLFLSLGVPMFVWSLTVLGLMYLYYVDPVIIYSSAAVLTVFSVPFIRQYLVSSIIMKVAQVLKIFPKVSDTERAALEAGSVWMDKELFSGRPNVKTMMSQKIKGLTNDEEAFIHGPVRELCEMVDDWEIQKTKQIPDHIWSFVKKNKFLGMIIPKEYGGLGMSAIGHSHIIERIGTVSPTLAITIMVPNSLGPAELLLHYGTKAQKDQYLEKLASGDEMPCFGLTEPTAGSDAGGLKSEGVLFKGEDGELYIKFNWNKRWITLSGISTVIGLAFLFKDPDQLLGGPKNYGITCALIPTSTPGIDVSKRHDPLGVPFYNCPMTGTDVVMPLDCIIGGESGIGKGWTMLMDCLSAGRGISLPSLSLGGAQAMTKVASAFAVTRQQFGMAIGDFEGIEEPMARIIGKTMLLKAGRDYTCGSIDQGEKPSVISAILKLHSTEMFRDIVTDAMDIMGGAGITQGPRNVTAAAFKAAPIGITVEGANILTRTLIIFGQGALRCHPYAYDEVIAAENSNIKQFDRAFFGHIYHIIRNYTNAVIRSWTFGLTVPKYFGFLSPYKRKLVWLSTIFALLADVSMLYFGGSLKAKQKLTGRLGDILSNLYLATATMAYYEKMTEHKKELKPVVKWALDYCFYNVQIALVGYLENFTLFTKYVSAPWFRLFSVGRAPSDALGKEISQLIQKEPAVREFLTSSVFVPKDLKDGISKYESTYKKILGSDLAFKKIRKAVKSRVLPKKPVTDLVDLAIQENIISVAEGDQIKDAESARLDTIQVDSFTNDEYLSNAS